MVSVLRMVALGVRDFQHHDGPADRFSGSEDVREVFLAGAGGVGVAPCG